MEWMGAHIFLSFQHYCQILSTLVIYVYIMSPFYVQPTTSFDSTAEKQRKTVQLRTTFSTITVREYKQMIGDCPACLEGAPITLGWSYQENQEVPFEEYEQARQPFRRRRSDLVLGVQERRRRLLESGVSLSDILRAESLVTFKKDAPPMVCSRKEFNKSDIVQCFEKKSNLPSSKDLDKKGKPYNRRVSQTLQKKMVSRAA